jgi:hypothetical protein
MSLSIELSDVQMQELAARVAELMPELQPAPLERLLTVDELAEHLGTSTEWIRRHQADIGGIRLSDGGGRNPIRFKVADVEQFLAARRLTPPTNNSAGAWRKDPDWSMG